MKYISKYGVLPVLQIMAFAIILSACSSAPTETAPTPPERPQPAPQSEAESKIDYIGLEQTLHMDGPSTMLGFRQKLFNTCKAGNGYSHSDNCETKYFTVIYFQLLCRDSDGTVTNLTEANITPLANRDLDWNLMRHQGRIQSDAAGYGQIRMVFDSSARHQRLKINLARKFLYMEAGDLEKVVSPASWCQP